MDFLILGGTSFLGRPLVQAALERGYRVTLFNRGKSNPGLFPEIEELQGKRGGDLSVLRARSWDAMMDTSGYLPREVQASAGLLADSAGHYTFVSSISVYENFGRTGLEKEPRFSPRRTQSPRSWTWSSTAGSRWGASRRWRRRCRGETLWLGIIVGPHDYMNRFPYWCRQVAEGGEVLAPGDPGQQVQLLDARDLAGWRLRMAEGRQTGVYNATGLARRLTIRGMLEGIREATGSDALFVWASEEFLLEAGVKPWEEMPFWVPKEMAGILAVDVDRAVGAPLAFRSLAETVSDTLCANAVKLEVKFDAGISWERERGLLRAWREATLYG
jgi:nucleoside-diphosphate-sugar epimerase